jgi:hypothetical protein
MAAYSLGVIAGICSGSVVEMPTTPSSQSAAAARPKHVPEGGSRFCKDRAQANARRPDSIRIAKTLSCEGRPFSRRLQGFRFAFERIDFEKLGIFERKHHGNAAGLRRARQPCPGDLGVFRGCRKENRRLSHSGRLRIRKVNYNSCICAEFESVAGVILVTPA